VIHRDLTNADYRDWIAFLTSSESWSRDDIDRYQLQRLKELVRNAYERTPGYRELYDAAGIHPDAIEDLDAFRRLPCLEKEMVRDRLEAFSVDVPGRFYVTTGGSTGIPTGMYRDPKGFARELASKAYQYYRVGWREGDRQIVFRGLQIPSADHTEFAEDFGELRCSTYHFGTEWMERYRQRALAYAPEWIRCYPSSGYVFARYLKDHQKSFPPIRGILCASEQLYDFQKALFAEVFGARVFSHYGHYEMAVLAGFCEHADTYHVLPQYGYAELVGRDGGLVSQPGEIGEVVGTSFLMDATPFIRYRTQDLAVFRGWGCASCGRPYQIWDRIEGRLLELIVTRTGRLISTTMLNMHDDFYDHLKQFQFHQTESGRLVFKFLPKVSWDERMVADLRARLLAKLGDDIELDMRKVTDIPLTSRGKQRLLVQELDLTYDHPSFGRHIAR
jgi:phenylacetate-CoA ligase